MEQMRVAVFSSFTTIGPHVGVVFSSSSGLYSHLLSYWYVNTLVLLLFAEIALTPRTHPRFSNRRPVRRRERAAARLSHRSAAGLDARYCANVLQTKQGVGYEKRVPQKLRRGHRPGANLFA